VTQRASLRVAVPSDPLRTIRRGGHPAAAVTRAEPPQRQHGTQPGSSTAAGLRSTGSHPEHWQPSGNGQRSAAQRAEEQAAQRAAQRGALVARRLAQAFPEGPPARGPGDQAREACEARQSARRPAEAQRTWTAAAPVPANAIVWPPPVGVGPTPTPTPTPTTQSGAWSQYRAPTEPQQYTSGEWDQWRRGQWRASENYTLYTWEQWEEWRAQQAVRSHRPSAHRDTVTPRTHDPRHTSHRHSR